MIQPGSGVNFAVTCYSLGSVLEAFGLTCAVTTALTVYTLQSKRDFSAWGAGWVVLHIVKLQKKNCDPVFIDSVALHNITIYEEVKDTFY